MARRHWRTVRGLEPKGTVLVSIGELIQDREAAHWEIKQLRAQLQRKRTDETPFEQRRVHTDKTADLGPRLLSLKEVSSLLSMSRSTIHKRISEGAFPKPVRIGPRSVRWSSSEIDSWRDNL